jgi:hypothetical protein
VRNQGANSRSCQSKVRIKAQSEERPMEPEHKMTPSL